MARYHLIILVLLSLLVVACGSSSPPVTSTLPASQTSPALSSTSTPTPTVAVVFSTEEPITPEPIGGEIEIIIPFDIYSQYEAPSGDIPQCVSTIPFRFYNDGLLTMIEGKGPILCVFDDTPEGTPITFHITFDLQAELSGELLPASIEKPSGWLDAFLSLDGYFEQIHEGYPDDSINPCPATSPCQITAFEVIPLPFDYEEGSTITTPWTFILHLR